MHQLKIILLKRGQDAELSCLAIDTLLNIFQPNDSVNDTNHGTKTEETSKNTDNKMISIQFSEMFIKNDKTNLELLFDLLDEFEFKLRWSTVKLVNQLVINLARPMQELILQIPRGCSRLIDLLNESREIIRNDVIMSINK